MDSKPHPSALPLPTPPPHAPACRLMRKIDGTSYIVPDERPPVDRSGQERWPPGWQPGRRVESERDVFELVGIRYRQPHERDAP
jgi:DNA polymerase mu